jgi:CubicO group peptidase (beta-lactamase class C family)
MFFLPQSQKKYLLAITLILVALLPFQVLAGSQPDAMVERLDAAIERAIQEQRIVGTVVIVARHGQIVYRKAFGFADRESRQPMRVDALFRLASMSKPLVSAAALALVDQGILSLDDPVTQWLPWFKTRLADGTQAEITIRQLLTHTSGLSYGFLQPAGGPLAAAGVSDGLDRPGITLEENLRRLAGVPLDFAPGSAWGYSLSIDVLGAVVAKAGGGDLPEVVARLITGPLGMQDTTFLVRQGDRLATPYVHGEGTPHRMGDPELAPNEVSGIHFQPSRATDPNAYPSGGAGMSGTAGDYTLFLEAIRLDGGNILKPDTARAMTANQIGNITPTLAGAGRGFGFGAAVLLDPQKAHHPGEPGTWGWGGVYGTHFFMDRKAALSVVVLTNTYPDGMAGQFPAEIAKAVYGN